MIPATPLPTAPIQRVLLVDDNDADNALHAALFQGANFTGELHSVDSGTSALTLLGNLGCDVPTLIVLDIHMPGMDGFEFARVASDRMQHAPITIVLMTTPHGLAQDQQRAATLPLIRHTAFKPLSVNQIRSLLAGDQP